MHAFVEILHFESDVSFSENKVCFFLSIFVDFERMRFIVQGVLVIFEFSISLSSNTLCFSNFEHLFSL